MVSLQMSIFCMHYAVLLLWLHCAFCLQHFLTYSLKSAVQIKLYLLNIELESAVL